MSKSNTPVRPQENQEKRIEIILGSKILLNEELSCNIVSLLKALARKYDVRVIETKESISCSLETSGTIFIEKQTHQNNWWDDLGRATMRIFLSHSGPLGYFVEFSRNKILPPILQGRKVYCADPAPTGEIPESGEILAKVGDKPVWITRVEKGLRHDVLLQAEPWLGKEGRLFEHLKGDRFFRLVPLVEWMRFGSNWENWEKPKIRACFMFDDPNLHWKSYGFISFKELAENGSRHNYCVSIASVPVDMWYFNKSTAEIFRANSKRLSLLFHGYNHSFRELTDVCHVDFALANLLQAIGKMKRLENEASFKVSMVMAPPYGGFIMDWMKACAMVGFEATSISWGSIWSSNKEAPFTTLLGADPGKVIQGLGILPRFRLRTGVENQILLSAYLGQPIIPVGHHWDLVQGLEILNSLAEFTNWLGDIQWQSPGKMARANYWWRLDGSTVVIRQFSRLVEVELPDRVEEAIVELDEGNEEFYLVAWTKEGHLAVERCSERCWVLKGSVGPNFVIELRHPRDPETADFKFMYTRVLGKRLLVEARDRLMPHLPRSFLKRWII